MFVRVEEVMGRDDWTSQHGPMVGWNLRVTTEDGNEDFISLNSKPNNVMSPGQEFEFTPNGQMFGAFKKGKREQAQGGQRSFGGQRQNTTVNAQQRSQSASNAQQAPKHVPTMSQAVSVLRECIEAVAGINGSDGHATTLFLARLRGDIRRDPSQAEVEADAAAKAKAAEEAKAKAEAAAAEAAKQAALAAMPSQQAQGGADDDIPF